MNMSEFLRKYWFICLICIGLIGVLVFYLVDINKDNVSGKKVDGADVVASLSAGDVTSDDLFDDYQNFNQSLLYNMYQIAVVDQSVEADSDMKDQAKTMAKNIQSNMDADTTGSTKYNIISQLASYGFNGEDDLYDYCMYTLKMKQLDWDYVSDNFDEYKDTLTTSPRTISIITMEVPNAEILTDEAQEKKDNIDAALENGDSFASVATAFSEDTDTAGNEGFYGYIDSSTTDLDSAVIEAAIALDKGETSDWITVEDSTTGNYILYKVHVDETDVRTMLDSDDSAVSEGILSALVTANPSTEVKAVKRAAESLNITFDNEDVQEKIESYINEQIGEDE